MMNRPAVYSRPDGILRAAGPVLHYLQGRGIYREGDTAEHFLKMLSGMVRICKFMDDGRRQIDAFYTAGDVFGYEMEAAHRFSAEAVSDCTVVAYRWRREERLVANAEGALHQLFPYAMRGMARAQDHAQLLGHASALEKLAGFLVEMSAAPAPGRVIVLEMSRQDVGDYLGLTVETISRTLAKMKREAIIEIPSAREIRIMDAVRLKQLCC
jgi:CRP/FNR family nitrogen fixation transcriptional regulator